MTALAVEPKIATFCQKYRQEHRQKKFKDQKAFIAWRKKNAAYKITFEDKHQDFLVWYLDAGGEVIDCQPFQQSVWNGTIVDLSTLLRGEPPMCQLPSEEGKLRQLNYSITEIEIL